MEYAEAANWAALPTRVDNADLVPPGDHADGQSTAAVDVFYVHPTTAYTFTAKNASLADGDVNVVTDAVIRTQASAFNGGARVYAPRYRQATLGAFISSNVEGYLAAAYASVERAFDYYLAHHNAGRPFILAGHSQGSQMLVRLLRARFDGTAPEAVALRRQLVVAYLIGEKVGESQFADVPPSSSPTDTGTFVSWSTFWTGTDPSGSELLTGDPVGPLVCVNPLSFTRDTEARSNVDHAGSVVEGFDRVYPGFVSARCQGGHLFISNPTPSTGLVSANFPNEDGDYHESDYTLFWLDLRANVIARSAAMRPREPR